jgi:hypothetical protein
MVRINIKYDNTLLQTFCKEHNIVLIKDYTNEKINGKTKIEGKCITENCINNFCKNFSELLKNFICNKCKTNLRIKKMKQTNLKKYGVECSLYNKEVKAKVKQTNIKKLGVEYPFQSEIVKEKMKQTNLKKLGVEYVGQSEMVKEKIKQTNLKNLGVENPMHSEIVKSKVKQTNIKI